MSFCSLLSFLRLVTNTVFSSSLSLLSGVSLNSSSVALAIGKPASIPAPMSVFVSASGSEPSLLDPFSPYMSRSPGTTATAAASAPAAADMSGVSETRIP